MASAAVGLEGFAIFTFSALSTLTRESYFRAKSDTRLSNYAICLCTRDIAERYQTSWALTAPLLSPGGPTFVEFKVSLHSSVTQSLSHDLEEVCRGSEAWLSASITPSIVALLR